MVLALGATALRSKTGQRITADLRKKAERKAVEVIERQGAKFAKRAKAKLARIAKRKRPSRRPRW